MSFVIQRFNADLKEDWDKFVRESDNGTIFNERKFLGYHNKNKFRDHSLLVSNNKNIVAIIPFNEITNKNDIHLFSHQGASFGGLISKNITLQKALNYVQSLCTYFQKKKMNIQLHSK